MNAARLLSSALLAPVLLATAAAQSETGGIGVVLAPGFEGLQITDVLPDSPAAKAKLTAGLVITKIDGTPVAGLALEEVVRRIRGVPGSPVMIETLNPEDGKVSRALMLRAPLIVPE